MEYQRSLARRVAVWNPVIICITGGMFSFLPAGIFYALNFKRLGLPEKAHLTTISTLALFCFFTLSSVILSRPLLSMGISILLNIVISCAFYFDQRELYTAHALKGGREASMLTPMFFGILWIIVRFAFFVAVMITIG